MRGNSILPKFPARAVRPALLLIAFDILCFCIKFTYGMKLPFTLFVHDFSSPLYDVTGWFFCHSAMIALGCGAFISFIEDKEVRHVFAKIWIAEVIREWIDLLVWNNSYGIGTLLFNALLLLFSIMYAWYKLK